MRLTVKVTRKPEAEFPKRETCKLCQWPELRYHWESDITKPFICTWCIQHGRIASVEKPPRNDAVWITNAGRNYAKAMAAYQALERELMNIRFQRRTGRMGDHIRWQEMTPEQRKQWQEQPAPSRAWMP